MIGAYCNFTSENIMTVKCFPNGQRGEGSRWISLSPAEMLAEDVLGKKWSFSSVVFFTNAKFFNTESIALCQIVMNGKRMSAKEFDAIFFSFPI